MGAIGGWDEGLWAIVPTILVVLLFWFVMRSILRADRTERAAQAKYEAEVEARHAAARPSGPAPTVEDEPRG
jgi:NADH:ubiquinone oxidoreductase subunit 3 (subunit A)